VKVCCIQSVAEAWAAIDAGAAAIGLVTAVPSGQEVVVSDEVAAGIARRVPPGVDTFLLTSRQDSAGIEEQYRLIRPTTLQLVDHLEPGELRRLRNDLPGVRLVQVVHVTGEESVAEAAAVSTLVDAVLLDSGDPASPLKQLGGTGRRHDWGISVRIREMLDGPVFLAGGLTPANAAEAVRTVGAYGLDVCSGLRVHGELDTELLRDFFAATEGVAGADPTPALAGAGKPG
jgi:phosphoribosylanthranilate isomerase